MTYFARQRQFGSKQPSKAHNGVALQSALLHRRAGKALSPSEIAGMARSYGRTEAEVIAAAIAAGCEVGAA
jgi:hypothetical protein